MAGAFRAPLKPITLALTSWTAGTAMPRLRPGRRIDRNGAGLARAADAPACPARSLALPIRGGNGCPLFEWLGSDFPLLVVADADEADVRVFT